MQVIPFIGTVCTGQGSGKFFVGLPWVLQQLKEFAGFMPYLGTLNLRLPPDGVAQRVNLTSQNGVLITPRDDYLSGYLYKARIFDVECCIVLPCVSGYPEDLLEIVAAENLRDRFNVKDGALIAVMVVI